MIFWTRSLGFILLAVTSAAAFTLLPREGGLNSAFLIFAFAGLVLSGTVFFFVPIAEARFRRRETLRRLIVMQAPRERRKTYLKMALALAIGGALGWLQNYFW